MKIFILILFVLMYVMIVALPKYKAYVTGGVALVVVVSCAISGRMSVLEAFQSVDYNVVFMLLGIMITVGLFTESNMPNKLADGIISKVPNALVALVMISVLSGFVSAFIDNVATVLMLAPIGIAVSRKMGISPVPVIICMAVSSNLQGAATLVGDTTSIMLGGFADMSFFDFFFLDGKLSIFWAVEFGALVTIPVLIFIFRKQNKKLLYESEKIEVTSIMPTILLLLNIVLLVVASFVPEKPEITNGIICMALGFFGLVYEFIRCKTLGKRQAGEGNTPKFDIIKNTVKSIDFATVLFLAFLFIIISAVDKVGIIEDVSSIFVKIGNENVFLLYTVIVFGSVFVSAFIDNIPYVATMLPVIQGLSASLVGVVSPYLLYFGLLCGATLGGNLTPVGASANVVGIGLLNKEGYKVSLVDFLKIGVPFTLFAVLGGYALIWFVWGI